MNLCARRVRASIVVAWLLPAAGAAAESARPRWVDGPAFSNTDTAVLAVESASIGTRSESAALQAARQSALGQIAMYAAARVQVEVRSSTTSEARNGARTETERVSESASSSSQLNLRATQCPDRYVDQGAGLVFVRCVLDKSELSAQLGLALAERRTAIDSNLRDSVVFLAHHQVGSALRALRSAELAARLPVDRSVEALLRAYLPHELGTLMGGDGMDAATIGRRRQEILREIRCSAAVEAVGGAAGATVPPFPLRVTYKGQDVSDVALELDSPHAQGEVRFVRGSGYEAVIRRLGKPTSAGDARILFRVSAAIDESRTTLLELPLRVGVGQVRVYVWGDADNVWVAEAQQALAALLGEAGIEVTVGRRQARGVADLAATELAEIGTTAMTAAHVRLLGTSTSSLPVGGSGGRMAEARIAIDLYSVSRGRRTESVEIRVSATGEDDESAVRTCERRTGKAVTRKRDQLLSAAIAASR
jgi:hypothetical protein